MLACLGERNQGQVLELELGSEGAFVPNADGGGYPKFECVAKKACV